MTRRATGPATLVRRSRSEADLLATVRHAAETLAWKCHHETYSVGTRPGYPDLACINVRQRRCLWAELKGPKGRLSVEQAGWLADLRAAGQEAHLWTWDDWDSGLIERVLAGPERAAWAGEGT